MSELSTVSSEQNQTAPTGGRRLQAVLLDMDGTLIESEHLWNEAEADLVADLGGVWTEQDHINNVGNAAGPVGRYIIALTGADLTPREVADRLYARFLAKLEEGAELRPGAKELVTMLSEAGVPVSLVTSTERELVATAIGGIGLANFDDSVAGDEVEANKPHPDPYLRAARRLGVDPARCVAVEDSVVGVTSAADAGCATVAIPNHVEIPPREGVVFRDSLVGIDLDWLESLVARD
ncbi:HAD family phosphatase [Nocardiopsis sp. MG754419]|uniref:HAD family hydrolase n=1 Tax=Nocardiopsis sp. MG754419 TaxID=2259865 RepID=UPI001BA52ED2|nr:HAD family phosphatase [Nocardiopsis sp. MG754419]MBR8743991.1 HAD family phosphatase [Nocardiopsis sp. MG754419]